MIIRAVLLSLLMLAHDGVHDDWLKTLRNGQGFYCCDGSDAYSVLDPDWRVKGDHYEVKLTNPANNEPQWVPVDEKNLVTQSNQIGIAKVWPLFYPDGRIEIRCFLPGRLV